LDKQKKKTKHVSDSIIRNGIKKRLENQKYTRQELLSVIREKSWIKKTIYTIPKKKSPIHKTTEKDSSIYNSINSHTPPATKYNNGRT
jgi:hypothetical protein